MNYTVDDYFNVLDGKISLDRHDCSELSFDLTNLVLTYCKLYHSEIELKVSKDHIFGLINYCLEGNNIDIAKSELIKNFPVKLFTNEQLDMVFSIPVAIMKEIYTKYKMDTDNWNILKSGIKQFV